MDAVRAFNSELSSLYEGKPPVSRAKMAQVTKCAIKAIKFYKHVVQSVEKFIQKCKPEYKVPGLYVIDSIVRQSRHQFGSEKDVFSPRFTKNIVTTFTHLLKCPVEERSRLVRVLNLWQKNSVFPVEVIQPLLDLAADPNNAELVASAQKSVDAVVSVTQKVPLPGTHSSSNGGDASANQLMQSEMLSTITKLLQQAQDGTMSGLAPEAQLQQLQHLQQQLVMQTERITKPQQASNSNSQGAPPIDSNLLAQIQMLTNQLLSKNSGPEPGAGLLPTPQPGGDVSQLQGKMMASHHQQMSQQKTEPLFNKKLLDFDYGDSDEEDDRQDFHQQQPQQHQFNRPPPMMPPGGGGPPPMGQDVSIFQQIQQMSQQQEQLQSEIGAQDQLRQRLLEQQQQQFDREIGQAAMMGQQMQQNFNSEMDHVQEIEDNERDNRDRRRRSRDRSRSPRRRSRRSRSRSRDKRRRSRSRDRHRRSRSRERERRERERERERERRKQGLPDIRENHLCICSTTLWFGHLTKHTTEEELREHIEKYGTIKTINMIPPRGCAFVCLTKRKEAFKALDRLKGVKVNGNALKVAWAPGIGVKESQYKEFWDVDQGATYIPWDRLPADITPYINGGSLDEDTVPDGMKSSKTGEEDNDEQHQSLNAPDGMIMQDNMMPPHQMQMNMPGQAPNFPMPGQRPPINMMNPGGPMGMLGMRPPNSMGMGVPNDNMGGGMNSMPGHNNAMGGHDRMGGPPNMGGPNNMGGPPPNLSGPPPNMGGPPPNMGGPNSMMGMNNMNRPNMGGMPGFGGPRPGMPNMGMRPGQMNMRPQGHMMGGQGNRMGMPGGSSSPGPDMQDPPMRMNSNSPRGPFGQFGNGFPRMQHGVGGPGGMRQPFFGNNMGAGERGEDHGGLTDSEMRGMAEPKEWPPDDEVNDEDQQEEPDMMDSDERMLPLHHGGAGMQGPRMPGHGLQPGLQALGNLFRPMLAGQRPQVLGLPHSQAAAQTAANMQQSILSLRMMAAAQGPPPPQPQMLTMAGGPPPGGAPRFAMTASGMRIPLPPAAMGVRPAGGMVPGSPSPRILGPGAASPALPVAVSVGGGGSVMVSRPGGMHPIPSPGIGPPTGGLSPDQDPEEDEPRPGSQGLPMMLPGGNNRPPGAPVLGRSFAPMTIRPRGGPGLLGLRPGAGGGNFRFGGPRSGGGSGFGRMERPMFGGRPPLRPPVAFFDQDDKDERKLPLLDFDDKPGVQGVEKNDGAGDIDERSKGFVRSDGPPEKRDRPDVTERAPVIRASGLRSRWSAADDKDESSSENIPQSNQEEAQVNNGGQSVVENSVGDSENAPSEEQESTSEPVQNELNSEPETADATEEKPLDTDIAKSGDDDISESVTDEAQTNTAPSEEASNDVESS